MPDSSPAATTDPLAFEGVNPILRVRDIASSIEYYRNVLGFKVDWTVPESGFASVSRGRCHLFLCQGDQGNFGTWVWIGVANVESVHNEYLAKQARIRNPPANYPWALEMQVEDPDGNVLRIGSDSQSDRPWGEWLDMRGDRWRLLPTNEWERSSPPEKS